MRNGLKAIFFDVGHTLLFPDRDVIDAPLHQRGIRPTVEQLQAIERRTKQEFDGMMRTGAADHGFWYLFYTHLLEGLGIRDEGLRDALVQAIRISANWGNIRPGTREVLDRIGARYRIGVISNADGKIAELLDRFGIGDCFVSITDSGLVGHEKPHPEIFRAALRETNVAPDESLYVGDVYSVDYLGATRAGMQAMLFDVAGAYRDLDAPRVESLQELEKSILV